MSSSLTKSAVLLLLTSKVAAQSDPFNSLLSVAVSVYTEVTSILASDAANTASSASSSASTTSSSITTTSSSSSTLAKSTSSNPSRTSAAAAATSSAAAHSGGGLSGTKLAIILGCVLGALALGLLALVLVICCKRRRRNSRNSSPRLLSPDGEEIESWRTHKHRPQSREGLIGGNHHQQHRNENAGMPNMSQHPAFANDPNHQNPFVPVPPAPRRSAPNSRAGLTDGSVPGQEPFIGSSEKDHHRGGQLAAGAGGAALGAAALHHHEKNKHHNDDTFNNSYDVKPGYGRRALPPNSYPTTTTNDDVYALNKFPSRRSGDGSRPYNGDDYSYGTGPYEAGARGLRQPNTSAPLSPFNNSGHHRMPSGDNSHNHTLMAAGAGALGGAALAHHHNNNQRERSTSNPRRSYDAARTPGPNALLSHTHPLPNQSQERELVSPISSDSYSSAAGIPTHHRNTLSGTTAATNTHHIPSEMPGDIPTPSLSSGQSQHRQSFGTNNTAERPISGGAPAAAALAHRAVPLPDRSPHRNPTAARNSEPVSSSSEDSAWRLSSGMPGGWGRNANANANATRRDSSPAANDSHLRNAGINPVGREGSPVRAGAWQPGNTGSGTGRRLRLADLKREEEEEMMRERERGGDGGVGRAM